MLKLIIGKKGSGKTKALISMVDEALAMTKGDVVCIEKGDKLKFDIKYQCRLIDTDAYLVNSARSLYGFVAGILASNHDVTDLFIDSALKICGNDVEGFDLFVKEMENLLKDHPVNVTITSSLALEDATDTVKKYL